MTALSVKPCQTGEPEGMCCRLLAADGAAVRALKGERPNGVSEMPDPEAAEYLAKHQTKALGSDVINAVKNHYDGTQEEHVQPASTDSHATTEEHVTEVRHHDLQIARHSSKVACTLPPLLHTTDCAGLSPRSLPLQGGSAAVLKHFFACLFYLRDEIRPSWLRIWALKHWSGKQGRRLLQDI